MVTKSTFRKLNAVQVVELQPSVAPCFDQPSIAPCFDQPSVASGFDTQEPSLNFQAGPKVQDKEDASQESAQSENFQDAGS